MASIEKMPWPALERVAKVPIRQESAVTPSRGDYARAFGVDRQVIDRWKKNGIPWEKADRIAVEVLGTHPGTIWPEWWHR